MPRAADALCLGGGEGPLERVHRAGQVALRQRDEQAVNHGELRDPAGHGARAEGRLPRGGQQHVVRHLGDRRPREVRDRDGGRTVRARLLKRVDGVHRGPGVRQADRDVALRAQRRRGERHVRVGEGERRPGDALQLDLQVDGHQAARADTVDIDPVRVGQGVNDRGQRADVQSACGVRDRGRVGVGDLLGDRRRVVVRIDVAGRRHDGGRVVVRDRSGERQPQFRVTVQADRPAEPHHAGGGRAAGAGQLGDAPPRDAARVIKHCLRYPPFDGCQVRQQRANRNQDAHVGAPGHFVSGSFFGCHSATSRRPSPPTMPGYRPHAAEKQLSRTQAAGSLNAIRGSLNVIPSPAGFACTPSFGEAGVRGRTDEGAG